MSDYSLHLPWSLLLGTRRSLPKSNYLPLEYFGQPSSRNMVKPKQATQTDTQELYLSVTRCYQGEKSTVGLQLKSTEKPHGQSCGRDKWRVTQQASVVLVTLLVCYRAITVWPKMDERMNSDAMSRWGSARLLCRLSAYKQQTLFLVNNKWWHRNKHSQSLGGFLCRSTLYMWPRRVIDTVASPLCSGQHPSL